MGTATSESHAEIAIGLLQATDRDDPRLVDELTRLINGVYATAESGLWREGAARRAAAELVYEKPLQPHRADDA